MPHPQVTEPTRWERLRLYLSLLGFAVFAVLLLASVAVAVGGLIGALLDDGDPGRPCEVVVEDGYRYLEC